MFDETAILESRIFPHNPRTWAEVQQFSRNELLGVMNGNCRNLAGRLFVNVAFGQIFIARNDCFGCRTMQNQSHGVHHIV